MNNEKLWKKFLSITKNKKYFELEDVDKLGIDYNILFVLGKKNIGKSYQINKLILSLPEQEKFIYGRFSAGEIEILKTTWNADYNWPYYIDNKRVIRYKKLNPDTNKYEYDKKGDIKGYCVIFQNLQNTASGFNGYENFNFILFDEIIPLNPEEIKPRHVENFLRFISNVERNKENLKIYLFGNNNGQNALFNQLQLSTLDNLKYRPDASKMLFINTQNLYKGIENQKQTTGLLKYSIAYQESLLNNKPLSISQRQIKDLSLKEEFDYWISLIDHNTTFHIKRNTTLYNGYKITIFMLVCEHHINEQFIKSLLKKAPNVKLITFNEYTANNFDNITFIDNKHIKQNIIQTILNIIKSKKLFFEDNYYVKELIKIIKNA